jgi:hypothetical protein
VRHQRNAHDLSSIAWPRDAARTPPIDLIGRTAQVNLPDLSGNGLLVIARLEHWFLRERNGLHAVRSLLSELARTKRRDLVGCDNWAWRFIVKGAGADLTLPRPQTFEPFDARRLRAWFATLAQGNDSVTATFRLAGNGDDVLACDGDGEPHSGHHHVSPTAYPAIRKALKAEGIPTGAM